MQSEISEQFLALAKEPEHADGLAAGALVLASEAKAGIDIEACLESLEQLTERVRPLVEHETSPSAAVAALNHSLFELEKFRGNREEYNDPRNSFLDEVIERRKGLPITLSVLYVDIARRLGFKAYGIGFPGHFLTKIIDIDDSAQGEIIVDPFFGRVLSLTDCAERLRSAGGDGADLDPRWLEPASSRDIFVRMMNNLKMQYLRVGDGISALGCFDRILLMAPDAASEYRDRGLLLERLDCLLPAIEDLSRFIEMAPMDPSSPEIRRRRDALRQRKPALN